LDRPGFDAASFLAKDAPHAEEVPDGSAGPGLADGPRWMDLNNNAIGIAVDRYAQQNKIKHGDLAKTVYNRIMTSQQGQGFVLVFGTDVNPATKGQKVGGKY